MCRVLEMLMAGSGVQAKRGFCMLCVLSRMANKEHWSGKSKYHPDEVHRNLSRTSLHPTKLLDAEDSNVEIKKAFNKNRQEDTHEFFRFVTDGLQNSALASYPRYALLLP